MAASATEQSQKALGGASGGCIVICLSAERGPASDETCLPTDQHFDDWNVTEIAGPGRPSVPLVAAGPPQPVKS
jgi:hypothetical protein